MESGRVINIFRVLQKMTDAWESISRRDTFLMSEEELSAWKEEQRRFLVDGKDVREELVSEFRTYLFSCSWTDSPVVSDIVSYVEYGTPLTKIAALVGLKESAFRMRVNRMTDSMNALLFDGRSCPEGVLNLTDLGEIKKCLVRLRLLRDPVDFDEEFSIKQLNWMKAQADQAGDEQFVPSKESMEKYFQAVRFLALTSRTFVLNMLDELDPVALSYALKDMQSSSVNSTKLLFSLFLKDLSPASLACEEETLNVKREYQSLTRG